MLTIAWIEGVPICVYERASNIAVRQGEVEIRDENGVEESKLQSKNDRTWGVQ